PIGKVDLKRNDKAVVIGLDKDILKRYPEFHSDAFLSMTDEEARRYEWRVLEAIDPQAARSSVDTWDYDAFAYYRQPDWFESQLPPASSSRSRSASSTRRGLPMSGTRETRERVIAREGGTSSSEDESWDRVRGGSE